MSYNKYYIYKEKVSYDNGVTWSYTGQETPSGSSIGTYDTLEECEGFMFRWVNLDPSVDYYCNGVAKYYKQKKQVTTNGGTTWTDVVPEEYRMGELVESGSFDCGTPLYGWIENGTMCDYCIASEAPKIVNTVLNSPYIVSATCDGSTTITTTDINPVKSNLQSSYIGSCITAIGDNAYSGCTNLEFVRIPSTVTAIGERAFYGCSAMTECSIPYGVISIGNNAFQNNVSLISVDLPETLTSLGNYAFSGCLNFRYICIPGTLTSISQHCFENCDGLVDIELPKSITSIGNYAFDGCDGINSFIIHSTTPPSLGTYAFRNISSNMRIYVPAQSVNAYKAAEGWSAFSNKIFSIDNYNNG